MSYTTRRQRAEGLRVCGLPGKMYLYIRDVPILPVSMSWDVASSQHNICKVLKKNVTSVKEERYNVTIAKKNNVTFVSVRNI